MLSGDYLLSKGWPGTRARLQLKMESVHQSLVQGMMDGGLSYKEISDELREMYPGVSQGLSERSVRRYVQKNNMRAVSKRNKLEAVQ